MLTMPDRATLVTWWCNHDRRAPLAADVDALLRFDVPLDKLLAAMEAVIARSGCPRSLRYFREVGEQAQSTHHKTSDSKPRGSATLRQLLVEGGYLK